MVGKNDKDDVAAHATGSNEVVEVDPKLLRLLVCPFTKAPLVHDRENGELISRTGHVAFPIRNGIPLLTRDAARSLDDD